MKTIFVTFLIYLSFIHQVNAQDLVETYQLALENDHILKQAYFTKLSVSENKSQSIAQMLPTISASANSSRDRIKNKKNNFQNAGEQYYWSNRFSINFSQPIFHWDHWIQLSQSDNRIAKAEAEYQSELQNLMVKTTEAYFNVLSQQDNLEFTIAEKKAIEGQLEQVKQRFDVGLIAVTDVHEAQAGFDQAKANMIDAENQLDDSKEALREIIGENEINLLGLGNKIEYSPPVPNDIIEWLQISETNNLNILAAFNGAEVSRKNFSIQQSGHIPTLDIVADYQVVDVTSSFGQRGDTQSVGLQLNVPLFQGGLISSRSKQAHFDYLVSKEKLLSTKRQVKRQLRNTFRDVISSLSRVKALKASVTSSESALEANKSGFEVGTRTMIDVLAEQRNLYRAKRDYSRSRYDYLINGIKLKQATSSLTEKDLHLINQYL